MLNNKTINIHIIFWALIVLIALVAGLANPIRYSLPQYFLRYVVFGSINLLVFYLNYFFLLPEVKDKRGNLPYLGIAIVLWAFSATLKFVLAQVFPDTLLAYIQFPQLKIAYLPLSTYQAVTLYVSAFFTFSAFIMYWLIKQYHARSLSARGHSQKRTMELQFLKSQLNPHFLFNALNNIYALASRSSAETPQAILKLSELMRYTIYESRAQLMPLTAELNFVAGYISLQKLRYGNSAYVEYEVNGSAGGLYIVPLIIISFIENAFKHGVLNNPQHPLYILADIEEERFTLSINNKIARVNKDIVGGVGITNVISRLDLLYPQKYTLNIHEEADFYSTELTLILTRQPPAAAAEAE